MKNAKWFILTLIFLCSLKTFAQDSIYYDAEWKVSNAAIARYFRLKTKKDDGWAVRDCFLNGKIQMEGAYKDDSCNVKQGAFSYYNEKGVMYHWCNYDSGRLDGPDRVFYDDGKKRTVGNYKRGEETGEWLGYYPSGKLSAKVHYDKGKQMTGTFFREDGSRNKTMTIFSRDAGFPGGQSALSRFLVRNLQYPDNAVGNNIQGSVLIGFRVSKEGKLEDIKVKQSAHPLLDKEALRVVSLMPDWEPLIIGGIICDSEKSQPINFVLEEDNPST